VPVSGTGLLPFAGLDGLLGAVVRPFDAGLAGEQPGAECMAERVTIVPVPCTRCK
jgi:hypothetical protein